SYWDVFTTGYAMFALTEAANAGFTAANPVRTAVCSLEMSRYNVPLAVSDTDHTFDRAAVTAFLQALCEINNTPIIDQLLAFRERLSPIAKGFLLLSLPTAYHAAAQTLADDLLGSAIMTATGAHWEGHYSSLWDTDTLTTAV